jgi:hypothetical protein
VLVLKEDRKNMDSRYEAGLRNYTTSQKTFKPASHTIITTAGNKDLRIPEQKNRVNCNHKQYGCGLDIEATTIALWGRAGESHVVDE